MVLVSKFQPKPKTLTLPSIILDIKKAKPHPVIFVSNILFLQKFVLRQLWCIYGNPCMFLIKNCMFNQKFGFLEQLKIDIKSRLPWALIFGLKVHKTVGFGLNSIVTIILDYLSPFSHLGLINYSLIENLEFGLVVCLSEYRLFACFALKPILDRTSSCVYI